MELVISIGTGIYNNRTANDDKWGWDALVNKLIATSVDTEDVHALLNDFLPPDKYFRFNPNLEDNLAIDEKNKNVLKSLKRMARTTFADMEKGEDRARILQMLDTLRPIKKK